MNKAAIAKHEIYNNLPDFSEQELSYLANFIDFMRHKKKIGQKKIIRLEGSLKGYDIDLSVLKEFKEQTWQHVDQEICNG
jgi:hypothetical protein